MVEFDELSELEPSSVPFEPALGQGCLPLGVVVPSSVVPPLEPFEPSWPLVAPGVGDADGSGLAAITTADPPAIIAIASTPAAAYRRNRAMLASGCGATCASAMFGASVGVWADAAYQPYWP